MDVPTITTQEQQMAGCSQPRVAVLDYWRCAAEALKRELPGLEG